MARETVAIGADHGGYLLKLALAAQLSELGFEIISVPMTANLSTTPTMRSQWLLRSRRGGHKLVF
jgi:ribose 5-phosphate isomerase RpiB